MIKAFVVVENEKLDSFGLGFLVSCEIKRENLHNNNTGNNKDGRNLSTCVR